jgi:outer membrane biosynthesis protein TonB
MYELFYARLVNRRWWMALRPRRGGRLPLALLATACLVAVTAAVSDADAAPSGLRFAQIGHWIANPVQDTVAHVNGATQTMDAKVEIKNGIDDGSQIVAGPTSAYVLSTEKNIELDMSTMQVKRSQQPPAAEQPFGLEAPGGPYAVYREAGTVVRLGGDEPATIEVGAGLTDPVATPDGTVWLHRRENGQLCELAADAVVVACPASVPAGHTGELAVVGDGAVFVDTESDTLTAVSAAGLGRSAKIGRDLPGDARIAAADVDGRIAVVDQSRHELHLVDAAGVAEGRAAVSAPIEIPAGEYAKPAAARASVVLLDVNGKKVRTYDRDGRLQHESTVPEEAGDPRLSRGQDNRVYVDGGEGKNLLVVGEDGSTGAVPLTGAAKPGKGKAPMSPPPEKPIVAATERTEQPAPQTSTPQRTTGTPTAPATQATRRQTQNPTPRETTTTTTTPPRTSTKPPPSKPGMPPGMKATVSGTSVTVSWRAAAANGATVTGYLVTWTPSAGGTGGSSTRPGASRSMTVTGLREGTSYRITVAAQNSAGRGTAATRSVTIPKPGPRITVSQGADTVHEPDCGPPDCAWTKVVMRGFKPNTDYDVNVYSDDWGEYNGARLSTDSTGTLIVSDRFAAAPVNQHVWAIVDGVESNHYFWADR